jgi:protein phosphatase
MRISDNAGLSDIGAVRENNEDRWFADTGRGLFIVADGLGGHAAGEVAAQRIVEGLPKLLERRIDSLAALPDSRVARTLAAAIQALNRTIRKEGEASAEHRGMGATVVVALVLAEAAIVANVGDCRAYLFRADKLHLLTHDHSLAQYFIDARIMSPDDPRMFFARQQLIQHVGISGKAHPWMCKVAVADGDRILLCSDGLTDMVADEEIAAVLRDEPEAASACNSLVRKANLAGGRDNVTVLVMNFEQ